MLPSVIDPRANRASQPDAEHSRWVVPDRIASVIRLLCCADSEPMNGASAPGYGSA